MGLYASFDESGVGSLVGCEDAVGCSVFDGHRIDGVAVIVVEYGAVVVTSAGWDWEATSLVGVGFAIGHVDDRSLAVVCA